MKRISTLAAALAAAAACLIALAGASGAVSRHPGGQAVPDMKVKLEPSTSQYFHTVHILVTVGGRDGAVHGKLSVVGVGGSCTPVQALRTHHDGTATRYCNSRNLAKLGEHRFTVHYLGTKKYAEREVTRSIEVTRVHTAMSLSTHPKSPVRAGARVVLRARLTDPYQGSNAGGPVSGTVAFTSDGATIAGCGQVPARRGTDDVTCSAMLPAGEHTINASYTGAENYKPVEKSIHVEVKAK